MYWPRKDQKQSRPLANLNSDETLGRLANSSVNSLPYSTTNIAGYIFQEQIDLSCDQFPTRTVELDTSYQIFDDIKLPLTLSKILLIFPQTKPYEEKTVHIKFYLLNLENAFYCSKSLLIYYPDFVHIQMSLSENVEKQIFLSEKKFCKCMNILFILLLLSILICFTFRNVH